MIEHALIELKRVAGEAVAALAGGEYVDQAVTGLQNLIDTNFDNENEVYAVNSVANAYMVDPIPVTVGRPVRIYLVNIAEYGVGPVAGTLAGILVFGLVVTATYWGIDIALRRWLASREPAVEVS